MTISTSNFRAFLLVGLMACGAKTCDLARAQILHAIGDRPSFEVATIKPWDPPPTSTPLPSDGATPPRKIIKMSPVGNTGQSTDRVHIILPVGLLIASAYNLPVGSEGRRILGPDWLRHDDQYEIQAKIDPTQFAAMQKMTVAQQHEQVALMEQSLLEDRFQLKLHFENRDMPVYALVVSKGGPKLSPGRDGEPGKLTTLRTDKGNELIAAEVTLDDFVHSPLLTGPADARPVLDHTGLKGRYNFTLRWGSEITDPGADAPSFFTAIQEQLGLRLVPSTAPIEVIVIDHIERPSAN